MQRSLAVSHARGSITWARFGPVVKCLRMSRKALLLVLSVVAVIALIALASSLHNVKFEPGRTFGSDVKAPSPLELPPLTVPADTPLWKILLFWALALINILLFIWLLPPEARKRLLRQILRFAIGILALILALKYQLIKLPELGGQLAPAAEQTGLGPTDAAAVAQFQPPQMAPWMVYGASLTAVAFPLLAAFLIYRRWFQHPFRSAFQLKSIADIARSSLDDLAAGRKWSDVIVECYVRMREAVSERRGLLRTPSTTPREFADRITRAGLPAEAVDRLTRLFESVRYGDHSGSEADIRDAAACLNAILDSCGAVA